MKIRDIQTSRGAAFVRQTIAFVVDDASSNLTDVLRGAFKPGYDFEIVGVQHFARDITAAASYMVKIGTTAALAAAATPADATRGDATLHATSANLEGDESAVINLHVTTDGTGTIDELVVYVTIISQAAR